MQLDRTTRTFLAVITLVASIFLAVNHIVDRAPFQEWWLAALLFLISAALWVWLWQEKIDETRALALRDSDDVLPRSQDWVISKDPAVTAAESAPAISAPPEDETKASETLVSTDAETIAKAVDAKQPGDEAEEEAPEPVVETADEAEPGAPAIAEAATVDEAEDLAEAELKGEPTGEEQAVDTEEAEAEEPEAVVEPEPETEAEPKSAPVPVSETPDDLQRVDGIGPKYKKALMDAGVTTFAKLASMTDDELEAIVSVASMTRPPTLDTWREQASFAAKGDWAGLEKLQGELQGGRRVD
ncbi:MAG: helix-hairpin-helix domain-containing protein [Phototrophicaceae bacterium]